MCGLPDGRYESEAVCCELWYSLIYVKDWKKYLATVARLIAFSDEMVMKVAKCAIDKLMMGIYSVRGQWMYMKL